MTSWEPELIDEMPNEFTFIGDNVCIQRKDIHEVEYHSLDGYQIYRGYECYRREISKSEYHQITNH